jgi:tetratricopeptide (TPR) repeat protein
MDQTTQPTTETAPVSSLTATFQQYDDHYKDVFVEPLIHEKTLTFIKYALLLDAIDEGWLYEQKGWMFNQLQRYREALVAFDHARRLGYANDGWLYEQKSYALNKLSRNEEALEAFERARRLGFANKKVDEQEV